MSLRHHVIGIVAHTDRHTHAQALSDTVDAVHLNIDNGHLGCGANHRQVWNRLSKHHAEWCITLEDDAIPIPDFPTHASNALRYAPTPIVSFYLGKTRPPHWQQRISDALAKAEANHTAWITTNQLLHAVAVAIRRELLPAMLEWTGQHNYLPIDEAIGSWARRAGHPISYTVPSLCDHNDDLPTLIKHRDRQPRTPGRKAWRVGTTTNWHTQTTTL